MRHSPSLAALVAASLAGSCFVSEGECESRGVHLDPCQLSARAGQTVVIEATVDGAPEAPVNWILPAAIADAFTVQSEPRRLTLIGRQNVSAVFPLQASAVGDDTRIGGAALQVNSASFGSAPPPFVLFGGDFPVGSEATATAAGGNLYYVAYADSSGGLSSLGPPPGPPANFFIRQLDIRTNQLLASVGDQFLQFTGSGQGVIEPNVAADCDGNGYWVDYDPTRGYVLRRLALGAVEPDERVLGEFLNFRLGTLSVACDGAIYFVAEASAGPTNEADGPVWTVVVPSSLPTRGYIGGVFQSYDGVPRGGIARLLADGSLDFAFDPSGGVPPGSTVFAIASIPNSNGTVLVGGDFSSFGFELRNAFARVSASGVVDALDLGLPQGSTVQAIAVQDNPSIADYKSAYVGGENPQAGFLRKLEPDGTISTTFNPTFNNAVQSIVVQGDGKLLVAGSFTAVNGQTRNRIARLNANGSLDQSFFPSNAGVDLEVHDVAVDLSGRVYVGGEFNFIGQTPANRLLRLLSDGSLDVSYDIGTGPGLVASQQAPFVYALTLQPDGKLLVGGGFDRWDGAPRGNIVRLLESGQVDASFGASTDDAVLAIALQEFQGKTVVGGQFLEVNDLSYDRLARLNPDGSLDQGSGGAVPGLQLYRLDSFDDQPRVIEPEDGSTLGFLSSVQSMAIDKQGRIVLGDPSGDYGVARLVVSLEFDLATLDGSFQPVNPGPVFDVAVDSGDAIYLANLANSSTITDAGIALQSIVGLNGFGEVFYRQQGYELACAGACASADCGTFLLFTRISSLGVAANGAMRIIDDVVADPDLPPECQESVRIVVLDPD